MLHVCTYGWNSLCSSEPAAVSGFSVFLLVLIVKEPWSEGSFFQSILLNLVPSEGTAIVLCIWERPSFLTDLDKGNDSPPALSVADEGNPHLAN